LFVLGCSLGCSLGLFVLGRSLVVLGMEHLVDNLNAVLVEKVMMTRKKVMTRKNCMMTMMVYYWKKDSMMKNRLMTIYYWKKDSTN
jgi:Na+-translocating ferredoxin:NAD+ oxidoreductase RnfE subunit